MCRLAEVQLKIKFNLNHVNTVKHPSLVQTVLRLQSGLTWVTFLVLELEKR